MRPQGIGKGTSCHRRGGCPPCVVCFSVGCRQVRGGREVRWKSALGRQAKGVEPGYIVQGDRRQGRTAARACAGFFRGCDPEKANAFTAMADGRVTAMRSPAERRRARMAQRVPRFRGVFCRHGRLLGALRRILNARTDTESTGALYVGEIGGNNANTMAGEACPVHMENIIVESRQQICIGASPQCVSSRRSLRTLSQPNRR